MTLVVVVDAGTCCHTFVVGVVRVCEFAVELKLSCSIIGFHLCPKSSRADLGRVVNTGDVLQGSEDRSHYRLGVLICVVSLVVLEKLFEQLSGRILMTDDVVKRLNNAFVMVSEPMRVVVG